jgi:poly(3-hydroxybutyrate) depolymerase
MVFVAFFVILQLKSKTKTNMRKALLTFCLLTAGLLPLIADNITVGGQQRSYNVYAPKNLGEGRPLLIFCHGYNQDAGWMQNSEFKNDNVSMEAVCDTAKFVVVFPNGIDRAWDTGGDRDINFIKAIIEKMVTQHKIDRNRIYLGGFSMGGMLTYNAINKMSDIIAAFVSCSGPSVITPKTGLRPIPLLHIQGTADNWGGVQPALNPWIKHNGCSTTDKVINNYNGFSGAKLHIWGPGNDGVEVRLIELKDKGHWICKEPQVYTGKEIWNFCKNYSLNRTKPSVSITSPKAGLSYTSFAPSGTATFPDIAITANADDPNGTIEKVEFFDGNTLLATCTAKPYKATLTGVKSGTHTLKVVATDNDGETSSASVSVTLSAPQSLALASQSQFKEGGCIPTGWVTYDSSEKRVGYSNGFSQGCRILQLTGTSKSFSYGLYFRNINGTKHAGYAKYGLADAGATLTLDPGHYVLKYKACNWNREEFSPLEFAIETRSGTTIASTTYTPTVNIGNKVDNSFTGVTEQQFEFDITTQGNYVIAAYADAAEWSDGMIGGLTLTAKSYVATGISTLPTVDSSADRDAIYDLSGRRVSRPTRDGLYIKNGKKMVVR